jgi:integrase/recombinase XerD
MFYDPYIYTKHIVHARSHNMSNGTQRDLFAEGALADDAERPRLSRAASIQAALGLFQQHMQDEGFALNTIKAFASDIRLLGKYLGIGQPIGEIGTKNLNDFLSWLRYERGVPCSDKSYARRVTTLKVFFGWLHGRGVLADNPASAVIQLTAKSPLPTLPGESQLQSALEVTQSLRAGGEKTKPDARPYLLLSLLLQTGVKKSEAMSIVPNHIDADNLDEPVLFVRYANPRLRNKERKLYLEPEWLDVLDEYMSQYEVTDTIFTCTARNLEYILADVAEAAGLEKGLLSFENLRWAAALRDWNNEVEPDEIRQKLGLSKITWRETKSKLERLAKAGETASA